MRPKTTFLTSPLLAILLLFQACNPFFSQGQKPSLPVVTITSPAFSVANKTTELATEMPASPAPPSPTPDDQAPMWIANPAGRSVLRVDPVRGEIVGTVSIDGQPEMITTGEGAVWALDLQAGRVFRIHPATNRVSATIVLPDGRAEVIAAGAGSVWVGMTGNISPVVPASTTPEPGEEIEVEPPGWAARIDPVTNQVAEQFAVQPVRSLEVSGSALWVLSHGPIDTPMQVIDLTNRQGMTVPFRNAPDWLVIDDFTIGDGSLWLFSSAHSRIFRTSLDGRVISAIPIDAGRPAGFADLLFARGLLWAATPWGSVLRVDPATNQVLSQADLAVPLTALYYGGGTVWAHSQQTGRLFRLDPLTGQMTTELATGPAIAPTVIPSPTSRVVIWKPCPESPSSRLKVGDIAYVTKDPAVPNRVRKEPNREAEILGLINPGASMEIIGGPTCADGWVWWNVKNADLTGWTAEGDQETYWLVPLYP